ncbi:unnamed protein product, partial [Didymodactylos carnosus]
NFLVPQANGNNNERGAVGGMEENNDIGMLNAIQESIRDFIRDIGIAQPVQQQQQNEGDANHGQDNDHDDDDDNQSLEFD